MGWLARCCGMLTSAHDIHNEPPHSVFVCHPSQWMMEDNLVYMCANSYACIQYVYIVRLTHTLNFRVSDKFFCHG